MTTLIIPGRNGSGPGHWQTWLEGRLPDARRVEGIDWDQPAIHAWAGAIIREIDRAAGEVWLVAHSFGCLATLFAGHKRGERIAGAMLVAPADPELFSETGFQDWTDDAPTRLPSVARLLPQEALPYPALLVLSTNDPWLRVTTGLTWASRWNARTVQAGPIGHLNEGSGHGPWPEGLALFQRFRAAHTGLPSGDLDTEVLPTGLNLDTIRGRANINNALSLSPQPQQRETP